MKEYVIIMQAIGPTNESRKLMQRHLGRPLGISVQISLGESFLLDILSKISTSVQVHGTHANHLHTLYLL